jgi:hypothetical protein
MKYTKLGVLAIAGLILAVIASSTAFATNYWPGQTDYTQLNYKLVSGQWVDKAEWYNWIDSQGEFSQGVGDINWQNLFVHNSTHFGNAYPAVDWVTYEPTFGEFKRTYAPITYYQSYACIAHTADGLTDLGQHNLGVSHRYYDAAQGGSYKATTTKQQPYNVIP